MNLKTIDPRDLQHKIEQGEVLRLIDVRTPGEFGAVHARGAENIPLDQFSDQAIGESGPPVYLLCKSGSRARMAAGRSNRPDLCVVEGGTDAWVAAGLPAEYGRKVIGLERQVRIVAGLLVLTGAVPALTVHPYWAGLSAFVGAGLVFAGVTDFCGMAILLGKMPWNRAPASAEGRKPGPSL